ncbi:hypothetical protein ACS5PN_09805 [Roseateles sp. NT4]|uniref:hypothetical protein n=1 Tax=Roseateles sp. NT4 TaxID=3453715 RepID=UPI003EE9E59A
MRKLLLAASLWVVAGMAAAQAPAQDCVRSEPQPLLPSAHGVEARQFRRLNTHEAVESFTLRSGDRFRVEHGGCEYVVLSFSLRPAQANSSRLLAAAQGLRQLAALKPAAIFDLAAAASAMEALARSGQALVNGQEYPVPGDGEDFLQARFMFDAAPRGVVSFKLIRGPL